MANVAKVSPWEKDGKTRYYITLDNGTEAVSFAGEAASLEIGQPLPEGWTLEPPKQEGWKPMLKAPRKSGGGGGGGFAAWRNTKEGQEYEQEAMDRRTALMQAVAVSVDPSSVESLSVKFYDWLRATKKQATTPQTTGVRKPPASPAPEPTQGPQGGGARSAGAGGSSRKGKAEGAATPPRSNDDGDNPWAGMKEFEEAGR